MYQTYQNTLAIPASALYENLNLLSYANFKKYCQRGKINKVLNGGNGRQALVEFSSLPQLFKQAVKEAYGDPYRQNDIDRFTDQLENNVKASQFFETFKDDEGRGLLPERIEQYYAEVGFLDDAYYKWKLQQINDEATAMETAAGDVVDAEIWKAEQIKQLNTDQAEHVAATQEQISIGVNGKGFGSKRHFQAPNDIPFTKSIAISIGRPLAQTKTVGIVRQGGMHM